MFLEDRITIQLSRQMEMRACINAMNEKLEQAERRTQYLRSHKYAAVGVSLAACLAIALFVLPWLNTATPVLLDLGIEQPTLSEHRSASPSAADIDDAMSRQHYEVALDRIDAALETSSENLAQLEETNMIDDEALLYEKELEVAHNYQLRWMRIYALASLKRNDEAIHDLEYFVTLDGEHQKEALTLLNKLRE